MKLCVVVKSDTVYRKIKQTFTEYEVLPNASHFLELQDYIRSEGDDISYVIIEEGVYWRTRAEPFLSEYNTPWIVHTGNFSDLEAKVRSGTTEVYADTSNIEQPIPEQQQPAAAVKEDITPQPKQEVVIPKVSAAPEIPKEINPPSNPQSSDGTKTIEVTKYIEKPVIKKVEVEKIVERIKEVPVETIVEREVTRKEIIEVKPNFDDIEIDFELPSIVPKVALDSDKSQPEIRVIDNLNGPTLIGIMAIESDIDISNTVFLLATSLAIMNYKPLIIGDDIPQIDSLEEMIFANQKEDSESQIFESEGVSYMRQGVEWEFSEVVSGDFTHILFWYESLESSRGMAQLENWTRTHIPLLVFSGAKWKIDHVHNVLSEFSDSLQARSHLLLLQKQSEVLKELNTYYPDINAIDVPYTSDPFSPNKQVVKWSSYLLKIKGKVKINIKMWMIFIIAILLSALMIWAGLQINISEAGDF